MSEIITPPSAGIQSLSITNHMEQAFLDYAMSVLISRALPDVRDGLKPVQRRIIYSMLDQGITSGSSYKKSARVVGDVIAKYHPHGDVAVYDTMVRMAQDFSLRYPLVDGQGNFGSVDGDMPAAMRYTECRMSKIANELVRNLEHDTVPFATNYSGEYSEPTVLPTILPNLLLNGTSGIAVGMATNIPPHNLGEIIDALTTLISKGTPIEPEEGDVHFDDPAVAPHTSFSSEADIEDLMEHIQGPDFPTKGEIYDVHAIRQIYTTGRGGIVMRGVAAIEEGKGGRLSIVITELPFQVNKARMVEKIADLAKNEKITGISDLRDESDRKGMRVVVELKRDARAQKILNLLFKHTDLQKTFNANFVALLNNTPKILTLKTMLVEFVKHRQVVIIRRTLHFLQKAREREHILEGLIIALDHLDDVIETIKKSPNSETARTNLMEKFGLSELQAQAILDMQLRRLAALEQQKIRDELAAIQEQIAGYIALLSDPAKILSTIQDELTAVREQYGDKRRTKVFKRSLTAFSEEDLIPQEEVIITVTESGYIKRLAPGTYKTQGRGGKGIKGMQTKEEDVVAHLLTASTHDRLLFFTNKGKVYSLAAHEIPEASRTAKGTALVNVLDLEAGERPATILSLGKGSNAQFLLFVTTHGSVKRTAVSEFESIRKTGKIAISLGEADELAGVLPTHGADEIILVTHAGQSIRFLETDCRPMGRSAAGVRGISLKKAGDAVVGMAVVNPAAQLLVITQNGYGKRTNLKEYGVQKRGGSGVLTANVSEKIGHVVTGEMISSPKGDLLITSTGGIVIRLPLSSVPQLSRPTQGVRLIKLGKEDRVAAVTVLTGEAHEEPTPDASSNA